MQKLKGKGHVEKIKSLEARTNTISFPLETGARFDLFFFQCSLFDLNHFFLCSDHLNQSSKNPFPNHSLLAN